MKILCNHSTCGSSLIHAKFVDLRRPLCPPHFETFHLFSLLTSPVMSSSISSTSSMPSFRARMYFLRMRLRYFLFGVATVVSLSHVLHIGSPVARESNFLKISLDRQPIEQPPILGQPPLCYGHQKRSVTRQVKKAGPNQGRWFYVCAESPQCKYFAWADDKSSMVNTGGYKRSSKVEPMRRVQPSKTIEMIGRNQRAKVARTLHMVRNQDGRYSDDDVSSHESGDQLFQAFGNDEFLEDDNSKGNVVYLDVRLVLSDVGIQPGARKLIQDSVWIFRMEPGLKLLTERFRELEDRFVLQEIHPRAIKAMKEGEKREAKLKNEADARFDAIPGDIRKRLYPFQTEGVLFGLLHGGRVLLADEMGLGKTIQAIAIALAYHDDWPLLVVCPSAVRQTWKFQIEAWIPEDMRGRITVINSGNDILELGGILKMGPRIVNERKITIISYDLAQKMSHRSRYQVIICDESHHIKTLEAQRTRFLLPLLKKARRVILVSGTPALSRPLELFPQIDAIRPGLLGNAKEFGERYCRDPKDQRRNHQDSSTTLNGRRKPKWQQQLAYRGSSFEKELHTVLKKNLLIRRLKKDVLKDLPPKIRKVITVQLTAAQRAPVEALMAELEDLPKSAKMSQLKDSLISAIYRATGPAKLPGMISKLMPLVQTASEQSNGKLLIFAHHKEVLDGLEEELCKNISYIRIDGTTSSQERAKRVNLFQTSDKVRVALLSVLAGGVGITLTAARHVAFAELTWTPGDLIQAEDRAHRVGQRFPVEIHYLLAPGTADEFLWTTVRKKLGVVGESVDGALFKDAQKRLAVTRTDSSRAAERYGRNVSGRFQQRGNWGSWDPNQASLAQFNFTVVKDNSEMDARVGEAGYEQQAPPLPAPPPGTYTGNSEEIKAFMQS